MGHKRACFSELMTSDPAKSTAFSATPKYKTHYSRDTGNTSILVKFSCIITKSQKWMVILQYSASNSSNPILIAFWQEKHVSALSARSGLVTLARTYMSDDATPQEQKLHHLVLGTHRSWHSSRVLEQLMTSAKVPPYKWFFSLKKAAIF